MPVQRRTSDHTIRREAPEAPRVHVRTGCRSAACRKHPSGMARSQGPCGGCWERRTQLILAVARYPQHRRHWLPTRQSAHAMLSEEHRSVLQLMNGRRCDANSEVLCWFDERFAGRDGRVELAGDVGHGWTGFRCSRTIQPTRPARRALLDDCSRRALLDDATLVAGAATSVPLRIRHSTASMPRT